MDESGTTVVFRVENQHCAAWGVAIADLHRTDPPVYVQDRDGGSWKPFQDRVSVACVEMVLSEVVTGRGPSGDMCELPGGLIAVAESAYEQMAVPEYRLWADPGITVRWFSAPGKPLRMDGRGPRCRLLAGGRPWPIWKPFAQPSPGPGRVSTEPARNPATSPNTLIIAAQ